MTPELWREVGNLFQEALALPGPARLVFLEDLRRESPHAAAEVERLLKHDAEAAADWRGLAPSLAEDLTCGVPPSRMSVTLRVLNGPHVGESFTFRGYDTFIVGRSRKAAFRLPAADMTLSRFQFLIEVNPPICRVLDMASRNGTRVNGRRVDVADLHDGDIVQGGRTSFAVSISAEGSSDMAAVSPPAVEPASGEFPEVPGYRLERLLGRGGMGTVFLACSDRGEKVAVKLISPTTSEDPAAVARFLREAAIIRRLEHPGIVGYRAVGKAGPRLFLAMEYVDGIDAMTLIRRDGPKSVHEAVRLMAPILDALVYAHDRGFVHRDVKPPNVLVGRCGGEDVVKLADFGLARIYQNASLCGLTMTGCGGGTAGFTPPEQILDLHAARPQSDQYGAAATLYYLLTGTMVHDFPGSLQGRLLMILNEDAVPIRARRDDLPIDLAAAVDRALAREPDARFPALEAFREVVVLRRPG